MELERSDYANLDEKTRIEALNRECEETHSNFTYIKPLTPEDIDKKNDEIHQSMERIDELIEQKKELMQRIKEQQLIIKANHEQVVNKGTKVSEMVWDVTNLDSGFLETINSEGLIVEKSRLKQNTQVNMFRRHSYDERSNTDKEIAM